MKPSRAYLHQESTTILEIVLRSDSSRIFVSQLLNLYRNLMMRLTRNFFEEKHTLLNSGFVTLRFT